MEAARDIPWLEMADPDPDMKRSKERASALIHPVKVTSRAEGSYTAVATTPVETELEEVTFRITR